jgi:hypothetical protein
VKRQLICITAFTLNFGGISKPHLRLSNQIERRISERNIFFERRGNAAPFRHAVAQHESIVSKPQQVLK